MRCGTETGSWGEKMPSGMSKRDAPNGSEKISPGLCCHILTTSRRRHGPAPGKRATDRVPKLRALGARPPSGNRNEPLDEPRLSPSAERLGYARTGDAAVRGAALSGVVLGITLGL